MKLDQLPLATQLLYKKLDQMCIGSRIISITLLCDFTGLSNATVRRHITILKSTNHIEAHREKRGQPYSFRVRRTA